MRSRTRSYPVSPGAYMLGLPFALGAFLSGGLAALAMLFISQRTRLKEDAVIGLIFTGFFGFGLFLNSLSPVPVDIKTIIFGNILAITPEDTLQVVSDRRGLACPPDVQVARSDGDLLRRAARPFDRSAT